MAFFSVDDQLNNHPKARHAGLQAMGLWVMAGSHCRAYKSDGHVPLWYVASWPQGKRLATRLSDAELWHEQGHNCAECPQPEDREGWVFHDWLHINSSAEEIENQRKKQRDRQRKRRAKLYALQDEGELKNA